MGTFMPGPRINALQYGLRQALERRQQEDGPLPVEPYEATGPNVPYEQALSPLTRALESTMSKDRDPDESYKKYADLIQNQPKQSAWRTAAAIGTSFLKPLREGGVPGMLATSPEQRAWAENLKLLQSRMQNEYDLAKEQAKQRGDVSGKLVQYGSDVIKPQYGDGYGYDPRTGQHTQVLKPDEMLTQNGQAGVKNRMPKEFNPTNILLTESGQQQAPTSPKIEGGNIVRATPEGGEVSASPADELKNKTLVGVQTEIGKWKDKVANTEGEYGVRKQQVQSAGDIDEAKIRSAGDIEEAKITGKATVDAAGKRAAPRETLRSDAAAAVRSFGSAAAQLRKNFLENVGSIEELQSAIGSLKSLYDIQRRALNIKNPGMDLDVDFDSIMTTATEPGKIWGRNLASDEKILASYDQAVAAALSTLENAANQAQESQPAAGPTAAPSASIEIDGETFTPEQVDEAAKQMGMSRDEFLELMQEQ